jgi:basic amino acid/polyamine antiporter, APA family
MWGPWSATIVSIAVVISSVGALNGWTLLMGQVPMAAAQDSLFPALFGRRSTHGVPAAGIIISAAMATVLVLIQASGQSGFSAIYALIVGLSTMTAVIPYAFCALAGVLIAAQRDGLKAVRVSAVEVVAFVFSIFVVYGCGAETVLYGLLLLLLGIPVYVWQRREQIKIEAAAPVIVKPAAIKGRT